MIGLFNGAEILTGNAMFDQIFCRKVTHSNKKRSEFNYALHILFAIAELLVSPA